MSIRNDGGDFKRQWENVQVAAFAPYLSDADIEAACQALGHRWRSSVFPSSGRGPFAGGPCALARPGSRINFGRIASMGL